MDGFGCFAFRGWTVAAVWLTLASQVWGGPTAQQPEPEPSDAATATAFGYHRNVRVPTAPAQPVVVVTEFFTHGQLAARGENLAVFDGRHELVPWRVLQVGPGDFCRIAFQTVARQRSYTIYYGGKSTPREPPPWTATFGLVLETRRWKPCDLNQARSVRQAFTASQPIGRVYVPNVFHRFNPLAPGPQPFLSLYSGTLRIRTAGDYQFFTTSQDCSFLVVDGREVAAAPGAHRAVGDARHKGTIALKAGPHSFEYLHAAAGPAACMVAAWQRPGTSRPEVIPPEAFGWQEVAVLPAIGPWHLGNRAMHDMEARAAGEVVLSGFEDAPALVRVAFRSPNLRGRAHWEFGDGQTSKASSPQHIYLHPGIYTVRLSIPGDSAALTVSNRIEIGRPAVFADQDHPPDGLAAYLLALRDGEPSKLDPLGLVQLVRAEIEGNHPAVAASVGKAGLLAGQAAADPAALDALVQLVGPLLRDTMDDPETALAAWKAAASGMAEITPARRAAYELEAADIALNDLLRAGEAKPLLDSATARLKGDDEPEFTTRLYRVWGEYWARKGDRPAARASYERAMASAAGSRRPAIEQSSWRGALSRSTEAYLRDKRFDRALSELRRWQDEYPADKVEGYLPLLQARYWVARGKPERAIALAGDALAVNPDSSDADRLAYLAAECEDSLGHADRAAAGYRAFLNDYPGSPLVPEVKQKLAKHSQKPKRPAGK